MACSMIDQCRLKGIGLGSRDLSYPVTPSLSNVYTTIPMARLDISECKILRSLLVHLPMIEMIFVISPLQKADI